MTIHDSSLWLLANLTSPPSTRASRKIVKDPNIQIVIIHDTTWKNKTTGKKLEAPHCFYVKICDGDGSVMSLPVSWSKFRNLSRACVRHAGLVLTFVSGMCEARGSSKGPGYVTRKGRAFGSFFEMLLGEEPQVGRLAR